MSSLATVAKDYKYLIHLIINRSGILKTISLPNFMLLGQLKAMVAMINKFLSNRC